jgi:hypothetical protein
VSNNSRVFFATFNGQKMMMKEDLEIAAALYRRKKKS